jgi:hypothetical protein
MDLFASPSYRTGDLSPKGRIPDSGGALQFLERVRCMGVVKSAT